MALPSWFRRKKPAPEGRTTAPKPRLDELQAELAALLRDADQRVDRMLERLRTREAKEGHS